MILLPNKFYAQLPGYEVWITYTAHLIFRGLAGRVDLQIQEMHFYYFSQASKKKPCLLLFSIQFCGRELRLDE